MKNNSIFVLMPFNEAFDDVFHIIRDAVNLTAEKDGLQLKCFRADQIDKPGRISEQILSAIKNSSLVIADVTESNPNVMYELGFAHALGKPAIILNQDLHKSPFDLKDFRQIQYDRTRLLKDCRPRLMASISDVFSNDSEHALGKAATGKTSQEESTTNVKQPSYLKPSPLLVAELNSLHLEMQFANTRNDKTSLGQFGVKLRELLDKVTVVSVGDKEDARNVAGTAGNCAAELQRGELYQEAEDIWRRAIGLFPDHEGLHFQYSNLLIDIGRIDDASKELERAKELAPKDERFVKLEMKLSFAKGKPNEELGNKLREAFYNDPSNMVAAMGYLLYLVNSGSPLEGIESVCTHWENALPLEKKWTAQRALADHLASQDGRKMNERAIEIYETLLKDMNCEDRHAVLHNVATLLANSGQKEKAKSYWIEAYTINPNAPEIRAAFSQRLAQWGDIDLARKVARGEKL